VEGIVNSWDSTFAAGVSPSNYVGNIFAGLGGNPDFGAPADFITKREVKEKMSEGNARMRSRRGAMMASV